MCITGALCICSIRGGTKLTVYGEHFEVAKVGMIVTMVHTISENQDVVTNETKHFHGVSIYRKKL